MKFDVNYLLRKNELKKIPKSLTKADKSLKMAEEWLKEAENNLSNKSFRSCVISSYLAMFHSARAILYFDGFREKTHFAIARYLEDIYGDKKLEMKWIELLDYYRELRNNDQYKTSFFIGSEEAEKSVEKSKEFFEEMARLLENEK